MKAIPAVKRKGNARLPLNKTARCFDAGLLGGRKHDGHANRHGHALFTEIEDSTDLVRAIGEHWVDVLYQYDSIGGKASANSKWLG
jgi:hypothetical protein